jgi:hypothetical protein
VVEDVASADQERKAGLLNDRAWQLISELVELYRARFDSEKIRHMFQERKKMRDDTKWVLYSYEGSSEFALDDLPPVKRGDHHDGEDDGDEEEDAEEDGHNPGRRVFFRNPPSGTATRGTRPGGQVQCPTAMSA